MSSRKKYLKRPDLIVVAVQLDLETSGFTYRKWGGTQVCKAGDWLVSNDGDTYTVDRKSFARTYRATGPGTYVKTTPVWAEVARTAGEIRTKEGATRYQAGDYVVFNQADGGDGYAISKSKFERMYQPAG